MDQGTEPIRQDIDSIRDSMTDKMQQIESRVRGQVDETVDTVRRTFDVREQVSNHPWAAMGVAMLAGYLMGGMGGGKEHDRYRGDSSRRYSEPVRYYSESGEPRSAASVAYEQARRGRRGPAYRPEERGLNRSGAGAGFVSDIMDQFGGELDTIKTAATAAVVSMLRDAIKQAVPQFEQEYQRTAREREGHESQSHEHSGSEMHRASMREQAVGSPRTDDYERSSLRS